MKEPFNKSLWITTKTLGRKNKRKLFFRRTIQEKINEDRRAPLFRKEFSVKKPFESATLNICGLGYFESWINEKRVGDHVLDPAQSDYERRVFYISHDVSSLIDIGNNCIGVMLGNGWYNQDLVWGRKGLPYGKPKLICELRITFKDGSKKIIGTDTSWTCTQGPVIENNIYAG